MTDALDLGLDLPDPRAAEPAARSVDPSDWPWRVVVDVFVPGKPAPQGSAKAILHRSSGRPVLIKDNNATQKSWRGDIRDAVAGLVEEPIDGAVQVALDFVMPRPTSTPKKSTPAAVKRPDGDKLQRAVWDALTSAGVYRDDSQVVSWPGGKRLAELDEVPGLRIRVAVPA